MSPTKFSICSIVIFTDFLRHLCFYGRKAPTNLTLIEWWVFNNVFSASSLKPKQRANRILIFPIDDKNSCKILKPCFFLSTITNVIFLSLLSLLSLMPQLSRCLMYFRTALLKLQTIQALADMFVIVCSVRGNSPYRVAPKPWQKLHTYMHICTNKLNFDRMICVYDCLSSLHRVW